MHKTYLSQVWRFSYVVSRPPFKGNDSQLDTQSYPKGVKVSDAELAQVNIERNDFHGEWNYTISPTVKSNDKVVL